MKDDRFFIDLMADWIWKNICYSDFQYCGKAEEISHEYGRKLFRFMKKNNVLLTIDMPKKVEDETEE